MQIHEMKLQEVPFTQVKSGTKTIELRLYDDKRKQIELGDQINFSNMTDPSQTVTVRVIGLSRFSIFQDLFNALDKEQCGWESATTTDKQVADMRKYYSEQDETQFGVLGIHIKLP